MLGVNFLGLTYQFRTGTDIPVRNALTTVFGGAQQLVASGFRTAGDWAGAIREAREGRGRRDDLRSRLARKEWELTVMRGLLARAEGLTALDREEFALREPIAGEVVGVGASPLDRTLTVNRGSSHGVRRDSPVMAASGLVGRVVSVGILSSQVEVITGARSGVAALTSENRTRGIIHRSTQPVEAGEDLILDYVPVGQRVDVGELVISSGLDQLFPKGLVVGEVVRVSEGSGMLLEVGVRAAVDFDTLERVFVLDASTPAFADPPTGVASP